MKIWLGDLAYMQQAISSDTVPAPVGMIAEYLEKMLPDLPKTKLFKFPEDISEELKKDHPDVIGFSNYSWCSSINDAYMKRIKEIYPKTITVLGGPNFPTVKEEQYEYLKERPWVDFYVVKEGEYAFYKLISALITKNSIEEISELPNLVFIKDEKFYHHKKIERIMDLTQIPSPYLSGRLDSFLDGKLLPIIQTNRGCPFTCTFCTEGQSYWSKVKTKTHDVVAGEISYISKKMNNLPSDKKRADFFIADSNFGMFKDDLETCKVLAKEQKKTGYPKFIGVTTGKNKQDRILEAVKTVNGAIKIRGSVQSLDPVVQENMKRKNISQHQIVDLALKAAEMGADAVSEVILGLPGDTKDKHFFTLKTLIDSAFNKIVMYQLMILPGTEMASNSTREKYKMETRFRVIPRCFGVYEVLGKKSNVAEIEEICVSNSTLSFDDYLECRKMNVIIEVFFNDGLFEGVYFLLRKLNIPVWDWLIKIYENSKDKRFSKVNKLLEDFAEDTKNELWTNFDALKKFTDDPGNIKKYINGDLGSNLILKYKSRAYTWDLDGVVDVAIFTTKQLLNEKAINIPEISEFVDDLINYNKCQRQEIFDGSPSIKREFRFDIDKFIVMKNSTDKEIDLEKFKYKSGRVLDFKLSQFQMEQMKLYKGTFGPTLDGITKTWARLDVRKFLRSTGSKDLTDNRAVSETII